MLIMVPGPTNVPKQITQAMTKPMINHRGPEFQALYERLLTDLKYAFQTKNDVYPLTCSGTGGVECAVGNLVARGDQILIPIVGVFSERLREAIVRFGGIPVEIQAPWGSTPSPSEIERALEGARDVKAVALVYNETSTGVKTPDLDQIARLAKEKGKLLLVDAVSALCGDELPVDRWGVDLCVTGSQKCLACPPGLSMVSVSEEAYEAIGRNPHRPYYFDLISHREFKKKLETPFTPAIPLFYALEEGLKMLKEEGLERRIRRHQICAEAFYAAFERMGLGLVALEREFRSNTVIAVKEPEEVEDKEFREILREKHGVAVAGGMGKLKGKIFRVGSMGVVSRPEVLATLQAVAETLKGLGVKLEANPAEIREGAEKILSPLSRV